MRLTRSLAAKALGALVLGFVPITVVPGAFAAESCPDAGPCVIVHVVGSVEATKVFSLGDLDALHDISDVTYATQTAPGHAFPNPVNEGVSLRTLVASVPLQDADVDPDAVTYAEVLDPQGTAHPLPGSALGPSGSNGFADGLMPVMYPIGREAVAYIRPLRGPDDVNVSPDPNLGGFFQGLDGGALVVVAHTSGTLLAPVIQASSTSPHTGVADAFAASVPSAPDGLTYQWDFGDGDTSTSATPSHAWAKTGTYLVELSVSAPDGSSGRATPVLVDVDAPVKQGHTHDPGTGTSPNPHAPVTGPTTSQGHQTGVTPSKVTHPSKPGRPRPATGKPVSGALLLSATTPLVPLTATVPSAAAAREAGSDAMSLPAWVVVAATTLALLCLGMALEWRGRGGGRE